MTDPISMYFLACAETDHENAITDIVVYIDDLIAHGDTLNDSQTNWLEVLRAHVEANGFLTDRQWQVIADIADAIANKHRRTLQTALRKTQREVQRVQRLIDKEAKRTPTLADLDPPGAIPPV